MLLIAKLRPQGDLYLYDVDLSELSEAQINALPEGLSVQGFSLRHIDLEDSRISAKNAILLKQKLMKLKKLLKETELFAAYPGVLIPQ